MNCIEKDGHKSLRIKIDNGFLVKAAILMTCYSRVKTTLTCLNRVYEAMIPQNMELDVFLVDDNSPDQTGKLIKQQYPQINVIYSNGNLYWNKGMRVAWKNASHFYNYDFYIWLNDDTYIETNAFEIIFSDYFYLLNNGIEAIISGVCHDLNSNSITYGGRDKDYNFIIPNGLPQSCKYINGNFTLISKKIFYKLGNLSYRYTHEGGDHDYGLRAVEAGFQCSISSFPLARCTRGSKKLPAWENSEQLIFNDKISSLFKEKKIIISYYDSLLFTYKDMGLIRGFKSSISALWKIFLILIKSISKIYSGGTCKIK